MPSVGRPDLRFRDIPERWPIELRPSLGAPREAARGDAGIPVARPTVPVRRRRSPRLRGTASPRRLHAPPTPTTTGVPACGPRSISANSNPWSRTPRSGSLVWRTRTVTVPPNRALSAGLLSKLSTSGKPSRRRRSLKRRDSRGAACSQTPVAASNACNTAACEKIIVRFSRTGRQRLLRPAPDGRSGVIPERWPTRASSVRISAPYAVPQ